jgi:predicted PurR-regulated permease PerM
MLEAFSISPGTAALTAFLFLAIQQLEGNVLTPRIQAQTIKVPAILVFLGVITGGALAGLLGVLLAVPTLATLRVIFDFFRVRLRTD